MKTIVHVKVNEDGTYEENINVIDKGSKLADDLSAGTLVPEKLWAVRQNSLEKRKDKLNLTEDEIPLVTWLFFIQWWQIDPAIVQRSIDAISQKKRQDVRQMITNLKNKGLLSFVELYSEIAARLVASYDLTPLLVIEGELDKE